MRQHTMKCGGQGIEQGPAHLTNVSYRGLRGYGATRGAPEPAVTSCSIELQMHKCVMTDTRANGNWTDWFSGLKSKEQEWDDLKLSGRGLHRKCILSLSCYDFGAFTILSILDGEMTEVSR